MQDVQREPIAIIGMGCRFPQARNPQEFWTLLCEGKDAIREVPADRWDVSKLYDPDSTTPGKMVSRWGGFLDQIDQFDWRAFGPSTSPVTRSSVGSPRRCWPPSSRDRWQSDKCFDWN